MPLILMLIGSLVSAVGPLVANVILSLGISFVAYSGVNVIVDYAKSELFNSLSATGGVALQLIGVLQVGTSINIIFSAYAARMILMGVTGGKLTKMVTK